MEERELEPLSPHADTVDVPEEETGRKEEVTSGRFLQDEIVGSCIARLSQDEG